jgi:hypothetical protein
VVESRRLRASDTGHKALTSPAVTCEDMIIDPAGQNNPVGLTNHPINPNLIPSTRDTDLDEIIEIIAIVFKKLNASRNFVTKDSALFFRGLCAMIAQGKNDEDIPIRNASSIQFIDQDRKEQMAVHPASNVID